VHRGKQWIGAAVVVIAVAVAVAVVLHQRREREWAHGGDLLTVDVDASLATGRDFDELVEAAGVPKGRAERVVNASQTVIVRVGWRGHTGGGHLELMALDKRVTPPKPLTPDAGWDGAGVTGWGWAGSYRVLAERYDYLARLAEEGPDGGEGPIGGEVPGGEGAGNRGRHRRRLVPPGRVRLDPVPRPGRRAADRGLPGGRRRRGALGPAGPRLDIRARIPG
jgi:hypothetical protein